MPVGRRPPGIRTSPKTKRQAPRIRIDTLRSATTLHGHRKQASPEAGLSRTGKPAERDAGGAQATPYPNLTEN